MVVEWLCPGLRPTRSNRPRLLRCKVILLDEHELLQDVLVSSAILSSFLPSDSPSGESRSVADRNIVSVETPFANRWYG